MKRKSLTSGDRLDDVMWITDLYRTDPEHLNDTNDPGY